MNRYALGNNICARLHEIGINQGTLSKWVNGLREPKASALYQMSKILGVTMEELMEGTDNE